MRISRVWSERAFLVFECVYRYHLSDFIEPRQYADDAEYEFELSKPRTYF